MQRVLPYLLYSPAKCSLSGRIIKRSLLNDVAAEIARLTPSQVIKQVIPINYYLLLLLLTSGISYFVQERILPGSRRSSTIKTCRCESTSCQHPN